MRLLAISIAALCLAGCASAHHGRVGPTVWQTNKGINPDAAKVQQVVAMQAKQAKCKSEVEARPGRDGTAPRDWKCKGPKQS